MNFKKNLNSAKSTAKKAVAKAKTTALRNAKKTIAEVSKEVRPEISRIKSDLTKAAMMVKKEEWQSVC